MQYRSMVLKLCVSSCVVIRSFFFRKKGILLSYQSRSIASLSMCVYVPVCVYACVRTAIMFLVNASPPKPLDIASANFQGAEVT